MDRILESAQRIATERAEARQTAEAAATAGLIGTPEANACAGDGTPANADSLQTAAAILEAQTATAAAGEATPGATENVEAPTEVPASPTAPPAPTETPVPPAPTETPAPPPPTETPPPEAGEVTRALPPADLPTTNPQGYTFNLEGNLTADLGSVQTDAPVYRLTPVSLTAEQVGQVATSLGISGAVQDRGGGTFSASGNGELFVTPTLIQYLSPQQPGDGDLPGDDQAIAIAGDWLRGSILVQPDLGGGKVVSRDDQTKRVVVLFTPVQPANLLAAYPSITISLGPGGTILSVASQWGTVQPGDTYQLRSAEEAWRQVEAGQGYIEADLAGAGFQQGSVISGRAEYSSVELAYTTAGPPGGEQYLVPVFLFRGILTPEGSQDQYSVRAYVPALASADAPVG